MERAKMMGVDYVRTTSELYLIAPNRGGTTFTYLDENLNVAADLGLGVMLELTEGVENGNWDCTDRKGYTNFSLADKPYWEELIYKIVTRAIDKIGSEQLCVTLLNEPDNYQFGAPADGQFSAIQMNVLDWMGTFVRSNFPDIVLVGPSLSIFTRASMTWDVIEDSYFTVNGRLRPCWDVIDYFDFHIYPGQTDRKPPPGPGDVFHFVRQMIDSGVAQLQALAGGAHFNTMRYLVSETNRSFTDGQDTDFWEYGSDGALELLFDAQLDALLQDERVWFSNVYYVQNTDSDYDDKADPFHHGLYQSDSFAPPAATTRRLKRFTNKCGNAFDSSAITQPDL